MISSDTTRPPPIFGRSAWQTIPSSTSESCVRIWLCWCDGKISMIRLIVCAAGRTRDEHETAGPLGEVRQHGRQVQLLEAADLLGDQPVHGRNGAALVEHVAAETRKPLQAEREVELRVFLESLLLRIGQHAV